MAQNPLVWWVWSDLAATGSRVEPAASRYVDPMRNATCSVDGCERQVKARGYCNPHYIRHKRYGDPLAGTKPRNRKPPAECIIDGCEKESRESGLCASHARRGQPDGTLRESMRGKVRPSKPRAPQPIADRRSRFESKVERSGGMCWNWTGAANSSGYGLFAWDATREGLSVTGAHRAALRLEGVEIADDMTVDHICFNTRCVKPSHLRVMSRSDNARRKIRRAHS